jgi:hypothetical protein
MYNLATGFTYNLIFKHMQNKPHPSSHYNKNTQKTKYFGACSTD